MGIGRNDPCPCGSGKKFKKCCFAKPVALPDNFAFVEEDNLDRLSNQVMGWIRNGKYEKAQKGCEKLLKDFPEVIDGYNGFAELYEKRGNIAKAIEYYKKCLAFIKKKPEGFGGDTIDYFELKIKDLKKFK